MPRRKNWYAKDKKIDVLKYEAKCKECGESYIQKRRWQKFCSDSCRIINFHKNKRKNNPPLLPKMK